MGTRLRRERENLGSGNGNYGETSWRGLNKLLLENNQIYASSARMNEVSFRDWLVLKISEGFVLTF